MECSILAKIESGRVSLEQVGFDLESVIDGIVETLSIRTHQKVLEIMAHVMLDVPLRFIGDKLRIDYRDQEGH
jgi:hypothetical protein